MAATQRKTQIRHEWLRYCASILSRQYDVFGIFNNVVSVSAMYCGHLFDPVADLAYLQHEFAQAKMIVAHFPVGNYLCFANKGETIHA